MNKQLFRSIIILLLVTVVCFLPVPLWAESDVHVEKAGTLSELLPTSEGALKITGSINGTDIKYVRQLITEKNVYSLDLSEARIVSGGVAYYETYKSEDDVIGNSMFRECTKLRTIVLPTSLRAIETNAFSKSGLRKADIPNSVTRIGGDAFAYCDYLTTVVIGSHVSSLDQGVFYSSPVRSAYVKPITPPTTPAYLFSSKPTIRVYSQAVDDYKQSGWAEYGTIIGLLENIYPLEEDSTDVVNKQISTYFEDNACTTLKAVYQTMSDEELTAAMKEGGMPEYMIAIAIKVKNANWKAYEQDFRIHSYNAFSDARYWNDRLMSSGGSYMGNPTGIYSDSYDPLYVFVDEDVPADATLYICGCSDNDLISNAKSGKQLTKGLNIIDGQKDALYYIVYTADTQTQNKALDEWPDIKIHIEGGAVNGYYDVARKSDKDYRTILNLAKHKRFTVKSEHALFHFKTSTFKSVWPRTIDKSINWFDSLAVWQRELMGYATAVASGQRDYPPYNLSGGEALFPTYYNNPNFAIEGESSDAGYANSSPFRTCYNSVECIRNSFDVSRWELDDWCANHECGHNNQRAINLEGGTEVSNNLFSNVGRFLDGLATSAGSPLSTVMNEYVQGTPFFVRKVDSQLRMYYQLYLYYHQARKNTAFYPTLFKALREDPLTVWGNSNNSALKFVRKVCEITHEDLTDFFSAYGFFEPFANMSIEDYGSHTMTLRQADIDNTLAEIQQYPKNRDILFVEDRAEYVLTTDFLTTAGQKRRDSDVVGQYANLGQFTDYLSGASQPSSYTYLHSDSLYAMTGTGGVGFLVLDKDNQLLYASNTYNFCLPASSGNEFTIYSVDADGSVHETIEAGEGTQEVYLAQAGTLADSLSAEVIKAIVGGTINGADIKCLRQLVAEGNLACIELSDAQIATGGGAYYQNYRTSENAIGSHAFYQCKKLIAIRLPEGITNIDAQAFANSGLKEAVIPDAVATIGGDAYAYCPDLARVVVGANVTKMSQGVFYSSGVKDAYVKALTPPAIAAYLFSSNPTIHVYKKAL
nr:leucine-rich repeat protein [Bacteroidaceae bacterium]